MNYRTSLLVSGSAIVFSAQVLMAGPLPDPPFQFGGFNPPDQNVLKQELAVGKIISKYAAARASCDQKAVSGLQKAYPPAGDGSKVLDNQTKWTACVAAANAKYVAARDKQLIKGTPPCLNQAGIDAIKSQLDALTPPLAALLYCDDGAASPDPTVGINIPDDKNEAKGEVSAAKNALKAGTDAGKCYDKAASAVFKNGGTILAADLTKFNDCIAKTTGKVNAAMQKLADQGVLPSCLPVVLAQGVGASAVSLGGQFTDETYCASPSAAFID